MCIRRTGSKPRWLPAILLPMPHGKLSGKSGESGRFTCTQGSHCTLPADNAFRRATIRARTPEASPSGESSGKSG